MEKRKYDSSVARMAGNIAAGIVSNPHTCGDINYEHRRREIAALAVDLAEWIVFILAPDATT